jgi:hypothetical protein
MSLTEQIAQQGRHDTPISFAITGGGAAALRVEVQPAAPPEPREAARQALQAQAPTPEPSGNRARALRIHNRATTP